MKKSQLTSMVAALLIVMAVILGPGLGGGAETEEPAGDPAITAVDPGGTDVEAPDDPTSPGEAGSSDATTEPSGGTASGTAGASGSTTETTVEVVDDGIELAEGISDARAEQAAAARGVTVRESGTYTTKVEVALYIHTYGHVPDNYVSKTKARNAGWVSSEGNLWDVLPGKSIGGGGYTNEQWGDEPLLPETPEGRTWYECDINYEGGYRGAERLVYSADGLVFYTGDHYTTFERLY